MNATINVNNTNPYVNFKKLTKTNREDTIRVQKKNRIQLKLMFGKTNNFTTIIMNIKHNKLQNI